MAGKPHDPEIAPRSLGPISWHRWLIYVAVFVEGLLLFGTFWGDPLIYLAHSGPLQFNPGELSTVATSPIWQLAVLACFGSPVLFKLLSLVVSLYAVYRVMDACTGRITETVAGLLTMPVLTYGLMGYETSLAVIVVVAIYERRGWAEWLLPFIRPEGVIFSFVNRPHTVIPFGIFILLMAVFVDLPTSITTRLDNPDPRYLSVFWMYGVLWGVNRYGKRLTESALIVITVVASYIGLREVRFAIQERERGLTFDTVALLEPARYINERASSGDIVEVYEIQMRYFLRHDLRVRSSEGLVHTDGQTDWRVYCDRDNGEVDKRWEIDTPGFLDWVGVRLVQ